MIEYPENQFSEKMPINEALTKFLEDIENKIPVRALHVGTEAELENRKQEADISERIKEARQNLADPSAVHRHSKARGDLERIKASKLFRMRW